MITKDAIKEQREQVRMLGLALGNWREAARQCGLSEGRVLNWVVRYNWKLPKRMKAPSKNEMLSSVVTPPEALRELLQRNNVETRLSLSTAARKAALSLEQRDGEGIVRSSRPLKDVVDSASKLHGWNVGQESHVNVAVLMPTEAEQAERRAVHARLDALAAKLNA